MSGVVVWITGLPSSGKSRFARRVNAALDTPRARCILDGDEVRACLVPAPGYSHAERDAFYECLAKLAALVARQGQIVLVPATASRQVFRDRARALAPKFLEVWVATSLAECEARDTKGLYARARAGALHGVPGLDEPFEEPLAPALVVQRADDVTAVEALCAQVLRLAGEGTQDSRGTP